MLEVYDLGGVEDASQYYYGLYRVQTEKLFDGQEQKDHTGSLRIAEILQILQNKDPA